MSNVWPASVPCPQQGTPQYKPLFDNIIRSNMEYGMRRRRRVTFVPDVMTFSIKLRRPQMLTLRDFYNITLKEVGAFEWTEFRSPLPKNMTYTFNKAPEFQHIGGQLWLATIELLTMKRYDGDAILDVAGLEGYYST